MGFTFGAFLLGLLSNPFSWFIFAVLDGTVFFAQILNGGGPGSWTMGISGLLAAITFLVALQRGEKRIVKLDWACLCIALIGIGGWLITNNALVAVALAALTDAIAKVPTIRKSYVRPDEESISIWSIDVVRFSLSIIALTSITLTTALSPAEIAFTNAIVVGVVLFRRWQLAAKVEKG